MTRFFFFSSRRRHTRSLCDWSSDVCSSDLLIRHENQVAYTTVNAWLTIAHHLGALARVGKMLGPADRHLRRAAQLAGRMGAPIWLARTQVEQARVAIDRKSVV